ncbi:MAG: type II toxin-antitoxin system RelE/ParE family toxin [Armatimonadetes bacterium]|nr:type II toxin-antitoxin system RelE/ParE family toxin [Armatimonadota bacterium]
MAVEFVETTMFASHRDAQFGDPESFRMLQCDLVTNPRRGDVIPGTGGLRKLRWGDVSRAKGKRSGLRIIYLYVEQADNILLLAAYDKSVATDLTPEEKRRLRAYADAYRDALAQRKRT